MTARFPPTNTFGISAIVDGIKVTNNEGWLTIAGFREGNHEHLIAGRYWMQLHRIGRRFRIRALLYENGIIDPVVFEEHFDNLEEARRLFKKYGRHAMAGDTLGSGALRLVWIPPAQLKVGEAIYVYVGGRLQPCEVLSTERVGKFDVWAIQRTDERITVANMIVTASDRVRVARFIAHERHQK